VYKVHKDSKGFRDFKVDKVMPVLWDYPAYKVIKDHKGTKDHKE
jgi:hypothetical protein